MAVTPELGAIPSLPALRVVVTPQLGSVPPLAAVSLPVEPKLGSLPALEPATLDVTPRVGAIEALSPVDLQVIPQLQPIPPLAPVDLIVNLRPGTTPPVQTVSAPLDFDPTRALATLGRVIGVAEADAAEIPTEFLPPPPITLPPIAAPQITLPEANLPPLALTADNTQALAVIDATQKDARTPLIATFDINPAAADASTQGFFSRLLSGMGDVAKKGAELLAATVKAPAELISKDSRQLVFLLLLRRHGPLWFLRRLLSGLREPRTSPLQYQRQSKSMRSSRLNSLRRNR